MTNRFAAGVRFAERSQKQAGPLDSPGPPPDSSTAPLAAPFRPPKDVRWRPAGVVLMPELKSCGVLIVRGSPPAEFLLMKHPKRWDLPKGHIDEGETELECALREMWEETGIPAEAVTLDPTFRYEQEYYVKYVRTDGKKTLKKLVIFLGSIQGNVEITLTEHDGYSWFPWKPPHRIQKFTIDPLLAAVEKHFKKLAKANAPKESPKRSGKD